MEAPIEDIVEKNEVVDEEEKKEISSLKEEDYEDEKNERSIDERI
jgi:hypothetical protein